MTQNEIGFNTTSSSPFIAPGDIVYFQGTDNRLLRINSDGSNSYQIGGNSPPGLYTSSSPFVFSDLVDGTWVYFRGTDNKLWKVRDDEDGSELTWIGNAWETHRGQIRLHSSPSTPRPRRHASIFKARTTRPGS